MPVKTIRFYSGAGLLPPGRTTTGHRRYGPADLARLQLLRALRSLDLDLPTIGELLVDAGGLQDSLQAHVRVLEVRMRALRRQLAVSRAAATAPADRTVARLHALRRIEAAEREGLLDRFWDAVLEGVQDDTAARFRQWGTPELPAEPSGEQLDAWLELAELAVDRDFRQTTRDNAAWFWEHARPYFDDDAWQQRLARAFTLATQARDAGAAPEDPAAQAAVQACGAAYAEAFGTTDTPAFRRWLSGQIDAHTDPRAARWWQLIARLRSGCARGGDDRPPHISVWLHAALRDHACRRPEACGGRISGTRPIRGVDVDPGDVDVKSSFQR